MIFLRLPGLCHSDRVAEGTEDGRQIGECMRCVMNSIMCHRLWQLTKSNTTAKEQTMAVEKREWQHSLSSADAHAE